MAVERHGHGMLCVNLPYVVFFLFIFKFRCAAYSRKVEKCGTCKRSEEGEIVILCDT
jgi:F0F1-type ATP synthase assembly protein I